MENYPPLGTQFKSYELTAAQNYWTLDPYQYEITKFKYNLPGGLTNKMEEPINLDKPGLVYRGANFEKLLPAYTATNKSVNDFPAQSYHRFLANDGYFNPNESLDNSDLWYYGADQIAMQTDALAGPPLNVQEVRHIIFPEAQRGGLNSQNLVKYSSVQQLSKDTTSWEGQNSVAVNNNENCKNFRYNDNPSCTPFVSGAYKYNSDYCRNIQISGPYEGSMPFKPKSIN